MGNSTAKDSAVLRRRPQYTEFSLLEKKLQDQCVTPICLPMDFLKAITSDFSEDQELGRGGYGVVYKGVLQNGRVIAVKRLSEMQINDDQFHKEVTYLSGLKHKNVVQLLGYCAESHLEAAEIGGKYVMAEVQKRLLCFEYLNNKSLDEHLSAESWMLEWHMTYEIVRGICHGLHYLHTECQIVNLNLKPANILLDDNMEPKITDFGMSRLFGPLGKTESCGGTQGYMAPEYLANGLISIKADIFSLGVIIIELITGGRGYPITEEFYPHCIENVVGSWRKRLEVAGRYIPLEKYVEQVKKSIFIGLQCVNPNPNKRPTAKEIVEKLTDVTATDGWPPGRQLVHFDGPIAFTMEELLRADVNVLGEVTYGIVYKAMLEDGSLVATRRFGEKMTKGNKEFRAEAEVLGKIRHPNLLGLKAYYMGPDDKLVVYDYMPKGSLSALLDGRTRPLEWATRMAIAKGIARGLTYLHDNMNIIHGTLTARNVLLDEHSYPKIADFGLFRLMTTATNYDVLSVVHKMGYCAPELFNLTKATTKTDVYSLGIIILRLLTGKSTRATSMDLLPQWVASLVGEGLTSEVFDPELMRNEDAGPKEDKLVGTLMLALQCVDPSPSVRPQAREVLGKLEKICCGAEDNGTEPREDPSPLLRQGAEDGAEPSNKDLLLCDVNEQSSSEWRQRRPADIFQKNYNMDRSSGGLPWDIPFHLLEEITEGFSKERKLGTGAFGKVYMGVKDGKKIAVKMLHDMPGLEEDQFINEFNNLARLQHPNIVQLLGYCHETRKKYVEYNGRLVFAERICRALCFEYMHYGSLDNYLSDEHHGLDWNTRYTIIEGICKGLKYLHEELEYPIYHLDLKPANILLNENMMPKIADFGLSRLFGEEQTQITKSSLGTLGYLPPEYIERSIISSKFDIFSLGVVIIKVMTGPTGYSRFADMSPKEFVEHVHENWRKRLQEGPTHLFESYSKQVKRCMEIALCSVEVDRHKRPSIGDINEKLNETDYG